MTTYVVTMPLTGPGSALAWPAKLPDDLNTYELDMTAWLNSLSDSLTNVTITSYDASLSLSDIVTTGTTASVNLTNGVPGYIHTVTFSCTTWRGRSFTQQVQISVEAEGVAPLVDASFTVATATGASNHVNLATRFGQSYNPVLDFGAAGDGVTDDTAALTAAINAVNASASVKVLEITRPHFIATPASVPALFSTKTMRVTGSGQILYYFGQMQATLSVLNGGSYLSFPTWTSSDGSVLSVKQGIGTFTITACGSGYTKYDIVNVPLSGIVPSTQTLQLEVLSIDTDGSVTGSVGAVLKAKVYTPGALTGGPTLPASVTCTGGTGTGLQISVNSYYVDFVNVTTRNITNSYTPPTISDTGGSPTYRAIIMPAGASFPVGGFLDSHERHVVFGGWSAVSGTLINSFVHAEWFGATTSGDATNGMRNAMATGLQVRLGSGTYSVSNSFGLSGAGQKLVGTNVAETTLLWTGAAFGPAQGCIVQSGARSGLKDVYLDCVQPDTSVFANLTTYPPAIYNTGTLPEYDRVNIGRFQTGFWHHSDGGWFTNCETSCFTDNILIDNSFEETNINGLLVNTHLLTANQSNIMLDQTCYALRISQGVVSISSGLALCYTPIYMQKVAINPYQYGLVTVDVGSFNIDVNTIGIKQETGRISYSGGYVDNWASASFGSQAVVQTGGQATFSGVMIAADAQAYSNPSVYSSGTASTDYLCMDGCTFDSTKGGPRTTDTEVRLQADTGANVMLTGCTILMNSGTSMTGKTLIQVGAASSFNVRGLRVSAPNTGVSGGSVITLASDVPGEITGVQAPSRTISAPAALYQMRIHDNEPPYVPAAVTAAGTTQATAALLGIGFNVVGTAAAGSGVILQGDQTTTVHNAAANPVLVYPPVGAAINNNATNVAVSVAVGATATFYYNSATQWYQ